MKIKKLLKNAKTFLSSEDRDRKEKKKHLKEVLRKLSKHEKKLQNRLEKTHSDEQRKKTQRRLILVHAQREKGMRLLKELLEGPNGTDDAGGTDN